MNRQTIARIRQTRIILFMLILIQFISLIAYASVIADQNGAEMIANAIAIRLKYLKQILYGVTSVGVNSFETMKLDVEKSMRQAICRKKNLMPNPPSSPKYLFLMDLKDGFISGYLLKKVYGYATK